MAQTTVCHYRCYAADKRLSMDIYADSLAIALRSKVDDQQSFELSEFTPTSWLEKYRDNRFLMRYLRYRYYPKLVKQQYADIHHVLDHGYAHLFPSINHGLKCVTVHDLIPMLTWKGLIPINNQPSKTRKPWLNLNSLSYLHKYDGIISISQNTKRDLTKYLNIEQQKISYIPPPIAKIFKPIANDLVAQFARKYRLDQSKKWVMISGSEFYKNHIGSLQAFKRILQRSDINLQLIKTGRPTPGFDKLVTELELESNVTQLFLDDFSELPLLYNLVDCLLFPSLYEGFGMPVAEALACGTPVVTSDRGSLPEIVGSLTPCVSPSDIDGLASSVLNTLTDLSMINSIAINGPNEMQRYSERSVGQMLQTFYRNLPKKNA
ncbi:MAG: glycosyltransferase involved in cell wall biosynthesis [Arenicella sp.]|jgi:glycosyltransferase involved in cell wall biosynthesis